ncbi:MAG TPA: CoB--CoM heterodisulfide reductase iron-sulfur subunit A family protein [Nitrospirota bacterium]|nr:CoB--CoM heterodisulfide reductase iron-sulfur subunit A family protein [Nitrospirota bacterium]
MTGNVLVIGGGFSGLTAAIEAAETGYNAFIIEKNPYLGGRVAQLHLYFPKLCPSTCGLEINFRRIKENPRIKFYTLAQVEKIVGREGSYQVSLKVSPRYINDNCVGCDACAQACMAERPNDFNFGMDKTKAAYLPFSQAFPFKYVIDKKYCDDGCKRKCFEACKYAAIDLDMKPETVELEAGAIVVASGWNLYDIAKAQNLGFGKVRNVITNMMMERLAAPSGPTKGRILRPSDGKEPTNVAFVQCAGSRDENHLPYCSYICCMASLKETLYILEQYPDASVEIFYIDMRTPGTRYEKFYWSVKEKENVKLTKGKIAKIFQTEGKDDVVVVVEDIFAGKKVEKTFDMVVLAVGMEPSTRSQRLPLEVTYTSEGLILPESLGPGIYAVGSTKSPLDVAKSVQDATGAALKSIQSLMGR